jgi:hypothetical protein
MSLDPRQVQSTTAHALESWVGTPFKTRMNCRVSLCCDFLCSYSGRTVVNFSVQRVFPNVYRFIIFDSILNWNELEYPIGHNSVNIAFLTRINYRQDFILTDIDGKWVEILHTRSDVVRILDLTFIFLSGVSILTDPDVTKANHKRAIDEYMRSKVSFLVHKASHCISSANLTM